MPELVDLTPEYDDGTVLVLKDKDSLTVGAVIPLGKDGVLPIDLIRFQDREVLLAPLSCPAQWYGMVPGNNMSPRRLVASGEGTPLPLAGVLAYDGEDFVPYKDGTLQLEIQPPTDLVLLDSLPAPLDEIKDVTFRAVDADCHTFIGAIDDDDLNGSKVVRRDFGEKPPLDYKCGRVLDVKVTDDEPVVLCLTESGTTSAPLVVPISRCSECLVSDGTDLRGYISEESFEGFVTREGTSEVMFAVTERGCPAGPILEFVGGQPTETTVVYQEGVCVGRVSGSTDTPFQNQRLVGFELGREGAFGLTGAELIRFASLPAESDFLESQTTIATKSLLTQDSIPDGSSFCALGSIFGLLAVHACGGAHSLHLVTTNGELYSGTELSTASRRLVAAGEGLLLLFTENRTEIELAEVVTGAPI